MDARGLQPDGAAAGGAQALRGRTGASPGPRPDGVDYNWEYPGYFWAWLPFRAGDRSGLRRARGPDPGDGEASRRRSPSPRGADHARVLPGRAPERLLQKSYATGGAVVGVRGPASRHGVRHARPEGHSSLDYGKKCLERALSAGLPPHKVTLGLPFYGRFVQGGDWRSYEDLVQAHHPLAPATDRVAGDGDSGDGGEVDQRQHQQQEIAFNGRDTIAAKTEYALSRGAGGLMVEAGQDCRGGRLTRGPAAGDARRDCPGPGDGSSLPRGAAGRH